VISRILGADMTLLFSLWFLINQTWGIKAAGRYCKSFILNRAFLSFLGQIIRLSGYLNRSFFLSRLLARGYCSIPIDRLGGRIE